MKAFLLLLFLATPLLAAPLQATLPNPALPNLALEARAVALGAQLRCLVCQAESINDSPAQLAADLRLLVREKIRLGWGDGQILTFIHDRYGDAIFLNPPLTPATSPLWLLPWVLCLAGIGLFWRFIAARKP